MGQILPKVTGNRPLEKISQQEKVTILFIILAFILIVLSVVIGVMLCSKDKKGVKLSGNEDEEEVNMNKQKKISRSKQSHGQRQSAGSKRK